MDRIEPALSAEEWEACFCQGDDANGQMFEVVQSHELADHEGQSVFFVGRDWPTSGVLCTDPAHVAAIIALANDALPDSDRRKITREKIAALREAASLAGMEWMDNGIVYDFAAALESYLPPESPK